MLIVGTFKTLRVGSDPNGPNYEPNYPHKKYPSFPVGSFGHVANRIWARYITDNMSNETLTKSYQGEDTSTGIWMDSAPLGIRETIRFVSTEYFDNKRDCLKRDKLVIGHKFTPEKMKLCYNFESDISLQPGSGNFTLERVHSLSETRNQS